MFVYLFYLFWYLKEKNQVAIVHYWKKNLIIIGTYGRKLWLLKKMETFYFFSRTYATQWPSSWINEHPPPPCQCYNTS